MERSPTPSSTRALEVAGSAAPTKSELSPCESHAANRLQLFVDGISCADALHVVPRFSGHVMISYLKGMTPALFPDHGWTCWAKPDFNGPGGAVQNFCLVDVYAIVYLKRF